MFLGQLLQCRHIVTTPKLNTDKHGQNTEYFSLKYGSPYIDFNNLEKTLDPYFLHFAQCYFICTFFFIFRFSVLLGQLLRCGHIVITQKPNTDQHWKKMEFFSLKFGSPYIDLNRLQKHLKCIFFAILTLLFYLYLFYNFFRFSLFLGQLLRCGHIVPTPKLNRVKNGLSVLFAKK